MDRFKTFVNKVYYLNRFRFALKSKILKKTNVIKIDVNEDLTKPYKDFVRLACAMQMKIVGHYVLVPKFQWNIVTVIVWINIVTYLIINTCNIWIFWGDLQGLCFCFATFAFGITGFVRVFNAVKYTPTIYEAMNVIFDFGKMFDWKTELEEIKLYKYYGKWSKRMGIANTLVYTTLLILTCIYPGFVYLANGNKILPYGFVIPGISYTENPGYAINYVYHVFQSILVINGFLCNLHSLFLFVMNACFQVDLIVIKLQKLSVQVTSDGSYNKEFIEIMKRYQKFIVYMKKIEQIFSLQIFIDFICFTFQNVVTLFVLVQKFWIIGYFMSTFLFVLLLIPSIFGAMIEAKNDRLVNEIYGIPWHLLNVKDRKTLRFFLESAQNASMLTCAGYLPLNVILFQKTYTKIYSYLMFLKDTVSK